MTVSIGILIRKIEVGKDSRVRIYSLLAVNSLSITQTRDHLTKVQYKEPKLFDIMDKRLLLVMTRAHGLTTTYTMNNTTIR